MWNMGIECVHLCAWVCFKGPMWFSISTLTQNRANVMSSRRRKISSMSCEVCGSVRKHDPTHTYTLYSVWRRLLLPAVEGFTENYNGGSKWQSERVRDTLDPGLNLTQMEDFSFTWPKMTSHTHTHKYHSQDGPQVSSQPPCCGHWCLVGIQSRCWAYRQLRWYVVISEPPAKCSVCQNTDRQKH